VQARFVEGQPYFPFYFRVIGRKLIVTGNLSSQELSRGSEITKINGVPSAQIIDRLLSVTTADGVNTVGARLKSIELTIPRENTHQLFDIYFPLFFRFPAHMRELSRSSRDAIRSNRPHRANALRTSGFSKLGHYRHTN
jgi:hypothetical protein